jgi:hypothetical protein
MKLWEWLLAGGFGIVLLYLLLRSKTTSSVIIDGSTGSSSQGSLNTVLDSISFGSSLIAPLTNVFGGSSGTPSLASGNAPLSSFDNSLSLQTGTAISSTGLTNTDLANSDYMEQWGGTD